MSVTFDFDDWMDWTLDGHSSSLPFPFRNKNTTKSDVRGEK